MRIISGEFRRRPLVSPGNSSPARPFPDSVREALFNLLRGHFEGQTVLDCFAGSGALGLEAISRGATRCVMIERDRRTMEVLRTNIDRLGAGDRAEAVLGDALGPTGLARCPERIHILFFDPPYAMVRDPSQWTRVRDRFAALVQRLDATGYAMLRTPWPFLHERDPDRPDRESTGRFEEVSLVIPGAAGPETHAYGSTALHLYMRDGSAA